MFVVEADTAEELRAILLKFLADKVNQNLRCSAVARLKIDKAKEEARANELAQFKIFLRDLSIKPKK